MASKQNETTKEIGGVRELGAMGAKANLGVTPDPDSEGVFTEAVGERGDNDLLMPSSGGDDATKTRLRFGDGVDRGDTDIASMGGEDEEGGHQRKGSTSSRHSRKRNADGGKIDEESEQSEAESVFSGMSVEIGEKRFVIGKRGQKTSMDAWFLKEEHDKLKEEELERQALEAVRDRMVKAETTSASAKIKQAEEFANEYRHAPPQDVVAQVLDYMESVRKVAEKSKNLKGTFKRELRIAATQGTVMQLNKRINPNEATEEIRSEMRNLQFEKEALETQVKSLLEREKARAKRERWEQERPYQFQFGKDPPAKNLFTTTLGTEVGLKTAGRIGEITPIQTAEQKEERTRRQANINARHRIREDMGRSEDGNGAQGMGLGEEENGMEVMAPPMAELPPPPPATAEGKI